MAVVLEIVEGAAPEHDVCQDVTTEAVEHGAEPGGHGTPARHLHRACNTEEQLSGTVSKLKCDSKRWSGRGRGWRCVSEVQDLFNLYYTSDVRLHVWRFLHDDSYQKTPQNVKNMTFIALFFLP